MIEGDRIVQFVRNHVREPDFRDLQRPFEAVATDLFSGEEVVLSQGNVIDAIRASISIPGIFTPVPKGDRWLIDGGLTNPVPVDRVRALGADIVIAVDVTALREEQRTPVSQTRALRSESLDRMASKLGDHPLVVQLRRRSSTLRRRWLPAAIRKRWLPGAWYEWWNRDRGPSLFDVVGQSIRVIEAQISAARLKVDVPDVLLKPAVGDLNFMDFHRAPEAIKIGYAATIGEMDRIQRCLQDAGDGSERE